MNTIIRIFHFALCYIFININPISACGYHPFEGDNYYCILSPTYVPDVSYYPLLMNRERAEFYMDEETYDFRKYLGNIALWKELLNNWTEQDIYHAIYKSDVSKVKRTENVDPSIIQYIKFAQECEQSLKYRKQKSWDYKKILNEYEIDHSALIEEIKWQVSKAKNTQLKQRYQYQLIRILRYSKQFQLAIDYFIENIEDQSPRNEIYYYTLDQVAGCYYKIQDFDRASYYFIKTLNHSKDRKKSALKSFEFCARKNAVATSYIKTEEDKKDMLFVKSLVNKALLMQNIEQFIALDAADPRVEVLFMKQINALEEDKLGKFSSESSADRAKLHQKTTQRCIRLAQKQANNKNVQNKNYWIVSESYLHFLNGEIAKAQQTLKGANKTDSTVDNLAFLYEVFEWKNISVQDEERIAQVIEKYPPYHYPPTTAKYDYRDLLMQQIAHLYYKNGQLGKAFLLQNKLSEVKGIFSLELLQSLQALYNQPSPSRVDSLIIANSTEGLVASDFLHMQMGNYYLYHAQPEQALSYYENCQTDCDHTLIPKAVFSNNIKECFACGISEVMTDEVYQDKVFGFIKEEFGRKELAEYVLKLESLRSNEKQWVAKLANYLLGNFYYNISNTGYFRGSITELPRGNHFYFNTTTLDGEKIIANRKGFNLASIDKQNKQYYGLSPVAQNYYEQVLALSKDEELNARCIYLIAKCELNSFYNKGDSDIYTMPTARGRSINLPKSKSFELLKQNYADTRFYDMIIRECSYFEYYTAHF